MEQRIKVEDMSDKDLFRTMTNVLWCWYDSGGISAKRSYQSSLVECFMELFTLNYRSSDIDGDVLEEAKKRCKNLKPREPNTETQLLLPFSEIEILSNDEFTMMVLIELCRWYEEDSERLGFQNKMHWVYAQNMRSLFENTHPEIISSVFEHIRFDSRSIIAHGFDRQTYFSRNEERVRQFEQFGYSPWTNPT